MLPRILTGNPLPARLATKSNPHSPQLARRRKPKGSFDSSQRLERTAISSQYNPRSTMNGPAKSIWLLPLSAVAMPLAISIHSTSASTVVPIAGTGFSRDIFADKDGAIPGDVTNYTGFARWVYMEEGAPNIPAGLQAIPSSGMVTSKNSTPFQLQPVDQNNVLINGDTFTLDTPGRFEDLRFLVTGIGGNGTNNFQATANFTDGTSALFQFTCNDWQASRDYNATDSKWAIVRDSWTGVFGNGVWTRELVFELSPDDQAKTVVSLDFVLADRLGLSAVSGTTIAEEEPILLTIKADAANPGDYDFSWDSKAGKLYDLVSETALSTEPATWPVWMDNTDIAASGTGTTTLTDVPGGGPTRFFAVIEKDPPPLLSEDFDGGDTLPDGWTTNGPSNGTAWEVGVPSGVASGPSAAKTAPNCAGTNITGYYTENADVSLVSASIAIPANVGATLEFQQFIDTDVTGDPHDIGSVRILDADNGDTPIATLELSPIEGIEIGWETNSLDLPTALVGGKNIKVEFRFVTNAGNTPDIDVFAGFYIDDVVITTNAP